jgi:hypothetical protein
MASPLASALKSGMEDEDYNEAMQQMKQALQARMNKSYDPTLLAMAQGFLAPTATGSFGESLGQVAKNVGAAQEQQQKEFMDTAQMRMQIAQAEREQKDLLRARQTFQDKYASYGTDKKPPTQGGVEGGSQETTPMRTVSIQDALDFAAAFPKQKDMAEMLFKAAQAGSDRYKIAMNGTVFDTMSGKYIAQDVPGQTQSDYSIPGIGTFKLTPSEYSKAIKSFTQAKQQGWGDDWATQFKSGVDEPKKPLGVTQTTIPDVTKPETVEKISDTKEVRPVLTDRQTVSETEAAAAAKKRLAEESAKATADATSQFKKNGQAALGLLPLYERAEGILKATPSLKKSLGVLEKGDLMSAIGTVVDEGVRVGNLTINIPSFRKIASQYAQDPKTINALAELAQVEAMWQFQQRQGLGSGTSVSNFEQQMVNQMGPNIKDPYDAYLKKLGFMKAKADFDRAVAQELKGGKQYEDFEGTPKFNELFEAYKKRIIPFVYGADEKPKSSSGSKKVSPEARNKLLESLR